MVGFDFPKLFLLDQVHEDFDYGESFVLPSHATKSWACLQNLTRLANQIAKSLVLCHVELRDPLQYMEQIEAIRKDPLSCLNHFLVKIVKVARFVESNIRN